MIYVENLMKSSKINKFNLVAGYKNQLRFYMLLMNNEEVKYHKYHFPWH